jgi:hypothetical protein
MLAQGLITGIVAHPLHGTRRLPRLAAARPRGVRAASFTGSPNGSVDASEYISFVLNTQPLLEAELEGSTSDAELVARGDAVVVKAAEEVEQ